MKETVLKEAWCRSSQHRISSCPVTMTTQKRWCNKDVKSALKNQRHRFRLPIQSCGSTQTYNTPGEAVPELQHRVRGGRASGSCWIQHCNTPPAGWHITMATRHSAKQRGSCQTCARAASGSEVWSHWVFFASSLELVFNVCASETWKLIWAVLQTTVSWLRCGRQDDYPNAGILTEKSSFIAANNSSQIQETEAKARN